MDAEAMSREDEVILKFTGGTKQEADHTPFPRINFDDLQLDRHVDYLIKGILDRGTNATIYGPSGDGKTFFTIDMMLHIACGISWRGRRIQKALAIYVASEAGSSIVRRFIGWRENKLGDAAEGSTPFVVLTQGPNLMDQVEVQRLMLDLKDISEEWGMAIGVVVFDTLSRSIPGGDENASKDMTVVTGAADRIRNELGAATIFVHHTGKDVSKGQRGSYSLTAASDMIINVTKRVATVEKSRDGADGAVFAFDLPVVDLGVDQDGDHITTCVVKVMDAPMSTSRDPGPRLSGIAKTGLQALRETVDANGRQMPETSTIPKGVYAVTLGQWRDQFHIRYGSVDDSKRRANTTNTAFRRAREALAKAEVIAISDPYVWVSQ